MAKKRIVGVSVTPEAGLEVVQIDYATRTLLAYGRRQLDYNILRREIGDLDVFKETLSSLMMDMGIPKGSEIALNIPTVAFKINDYPAAMDQVQVESAIVEDLYENQFLQNYEPCYSYAVLPSSTMQFNRVAYTAAQKSTMIEIAMFIRDLGYKLAYIDTSISSVLNSLIYLDKVNTDPETKWTLLTIENSCCRIISMIGGCYVDVYEEFINIGEVLSDAENYAIVIAAVEQVLKNLPSKYLCIVSKTNAISAEILSSKLTYSSPIIYQEVNCYLKEPLLNIGPNIESDNVRTLTLDAIGAGIYPDFAKVSYQNFNMFNKTLGDIYLAEQPLVIAGIPLTNALLVTLFIIVSIIIALVTFGIYGVKMNEKKQLEEKQAQMQEEIAEIDRYLELHKNVSPDQFDEGEQVRIGLAHNKNIYSYYSTVGKEIPQKLWLTHLKLGDKTTIEGQADNIESVYSFFKNIKDYDPESDIRLQKLGLATSGGVSKVINKVAEGEIDTESILTTLNADFYEFKISNEPEVKQVIKTDVEDLETIEEIVN